MNSLVVAPAPEESMSGVRTPVSSVSRTARSSVRAALRSPRPSPSISAVASSMALGLATPWPAISSAEPCVGPNIPLPPEPTRPDATIRMPSWAKAAVLASASANGCSLAMTSKSAGWRRSPVTTASNGCRSTRTPSQRSAAPARPPCQGALEPTAVSRARRLNASRKALSTASSTASSTSGLTTASSLPRAHTRVIRQRRSSSALRTSSAGSRVAATSIASASAQAVRVTWGSGCPNRRSASPPKGT
jgi:hypothetical protein